MEEPKILFAKIKDSAIIPSKELEDAGYDIYACWEGTSKKDRVISPHTTKLIPTGIACALPSDYYFQVEERGSTGSKGIKKSAGVVDSGYRGEIFIALTNTNDRHIIFDNKERYLEEALIELLKWQQVDVDNIKEQDRQDMENFLKQQSPTVYDSLPDETKETLIKRTFLDLRDPKQEENLRKNINRAIFYPPDKAIAQLVLHKVYNLEVKEIPYEILKEIPSKRGTNNLGSSGK